MKTITGIRHSCSRLSYSLMALLFIATVITPIFTPGVTEAATGGTLIIKALPQDGVDAKDANSMLSMWYASSFSDYGSCNTASTTQHLEDRYRGTAAQGGKVSIPLTSAGVTCTGVHLKAWQPARMTSTFVPFLSVYGQQIEHLGYQLKILKDTTNAPSGTAGNYCNSQKSCVMNFDSGTLEIGLVISPYFSPLSTLPRLSVSSVGSDKVSLNWSSLKNSANNRSVEGWYLYEDDSKHVINGGWYDAANGSNDPGGANKPLAASAHSYTVTNLKPCTTYHFGLQMRQVVQRPDRSKFNGIDILNYVTVKTTGCKTPALPTTPETTVSTPNYHQSWGTIDTTGQQDGPVAQSGKTIPTTKTNVPQTILPTYFSAQLVEGSSAVRLEWGGANGFNTSYRIERSTDNKVWESVADAVTSNYIVDYDTDFDTPYNYRLKVVDSQGHASPESVLSIVTQHFDANISKDSTLQLASKDKVASIVIPADAISEDANCFIAPANDVPLLGSRKQPVIGGPYKVVCQQKDGSQVQQFSKPIAMRVTLPADVATSYHDVVLRTYSPTENAWKTVVAKNKGKNVYELKSDNIALVALASPNTTPWWITSLQVLLIGGGLAFVGVQILRYRARITQRKHAEALAQDIMAQRKRYIIPLVASNCLQINIKFTTISVIQKLQMEGRQ